MSERVIRYLLLTALIGTFTWLFVKSPMTTRWLDFPVYWEAGLKAVVAQTVYDVEGHFQYKYSPLIALLFGKFFRSVPFESASWFFQKTMLILWASLLIRFAKANVITLFILVLFFGNALKLDLELGQMNAVVLFLLTVLFSSLGRMKSWKEDLPFGFLFSIAVQVKLFSFILIPVLIFRKEWAKLFSGLIFLPVLSLGGVALFHGWDFSLAENSAWLRTLFLSTDGLLVSEQNVGLLGTLAKTLGLVAAQGIWGLAGISFLVYLWKNRTRSVEWFRDILIYSVAIFNPLVWSYWILYALPLAGSKTPDFLGALRRRSPRERFFFVITAFFVFAAFNGQHARWAWSGGILCALILFGIAASRVRADRYDVFSRSP